MFCAYPQNCAILNTSMFVFVL